MAKPKFEDKRNREIIGKLVKDDDGEYSIDGGDVFQPMSLSELLEPFEGFEIAIKLNKEV